MSGKLFKGRTVAVFSLPGAFTPTCSSSHLPRFNELAPAFKENGVDQVVCMAVNDPIGIERQRVAGECLVQGVGQAHRVEDARHSAA